ncbi:hypothetical protein [Streptomyces sp. NPDC048527]|uniref:hypothetical protein n=1 Tax=Streptomyces sp. NPDC048527 TaxID=3365568 RepID=UPI00371533A9
MSVYAPMLELKSGVWESVEAPHDATETGPVRGTLIQGPTLFVLLRQPDAARRLYSTEGLATLPHPEHLVLSRQEGLAGAVRRRGDGFAWDPWTAFQPQPREPRNAFLHYEQGCMVRTLAGPGVRQEFWDLVEQGEGAAAGARLLDHEDRCAGLIVRCGSWFGYARGRTRSLPGNAPLSERMDADGSAGDAADLLDCEVSVGRVHGGIWVIEHSTLPQRKGAVLRPRFDDVTGGLTVSDHSGPGGRRKQRQWHLRFLEGPAALLSAA